MSGNEAADCTEARPESRSFDRLLMLCGLVGMVGILLLARYLQADPRGYGTHEQLGFPPCLTQRYLHLPCPFCGMTTAFSLMAHARPLDAFLVQPAGALAFVAVLACCLALAVILASGRTVSVNSASAAVSRWGRYLWLPLLLAWVYKIVVAVFVSS